jgi:hypothetical protein
VDAVAVLVVLRAVEELLGLLARREHPQVSAGAARGDLVDGVDVVAVGGLELLQTHDVGGEP